MNSRTKPLYAGYTALVAGSIPAESMWDVSTEGFDVELTEAGALAIIERLGLAHVIDPRIVSATTFAAIIAGGPLFLLHLRERGLILPGCIQRAYPLQSTELIQVHTILLLRE
jgi:hypothetical protein